MKRMMNGLTTTKRFKPRSGPNKEDLIIRADVDEQKGHPDISFATNIAKQKENNLRI